MQRRIRTLIVHSGKDLFRYKSFFLPVFVLIMADRLIKRFVHGDRSALERVSFKFFLEVYGRFSLVRNEYRAYYDARWNRSSPDAGSGSAPGQMRNRSLRAADGI